MAAVLLTGLYGASGQWLLDKFSVVDPITTGVSVGTSSHSIGTINTIIITLLIIPDLKTLRALRVQEYVVFVPLFQIIDCLFRNLMLLLSFNS
jgi:hypothetical protein